MSYLYSIKGLLLGGHGTTTDSLCVRTAYSRIRLSTT